MSLKKQSESFAGKVDGRDEGGCGGDCILSEDFLVREDGARLFVRSWTPRGVVKAEVVLTHGMGEHSARYFHVGEFFAAHGIRLCAYDQRGHGRSTGKRGDVESYKALLDDLQQVTDHCATGGVPLFLYGHSFGAQITLNFSMDRELRVRGAIIASPLLELVFRPKRWKLWLARLALHLCPSHTQTTGMSDSLLSRDQAFLRTLRDRGLMHRQMSARLFSAICGAAQAAMENAPRFRLPLLLIHGGDDPVTSMRASHKFFKQAGSRDKTLRIFPGMLHETHNELGRDEVLNEVVRWICGRVHAKPDQAG